MVTKYFIFIVVLLFSCKTTESSKQQNTEQQQPSMVAVFQSDSANVQAFTPPKIIGGYETLDENLVYPDRAQEQNVEGRVLLRFMVTKEGRAKNIEVIEGIGFGCDQAAKTAIKKSPFTPAKKNGEPVKTKVTRSIFFQL
jgi:protein TonB